MTYSVQTVCTADYYQNYIPFFVYSVKKALPEADITVFVRGRLNEQVAALYDANKINAKILEDFCLDHPYNISTTNALRFTDCAANKYHEYTLITDIDLIFLPQEPSIIYKFAKEAFDAKQCFCGWHGPQDAKEERVVGGFFLITPEWLYRTKEARAKYSDLLKENVEGKYRESDEAVLCKILKESGLPIPQSESFPTEYRGVHLGDFKFPGRWQNIELMKMFLTDANCKKYRELERDPGWEELVTSINDPTVDQQLINLDAHISQRGY